METIYGDFNNIDVHYRVRLDTFKTIADIEEKAIKLVPGMEIIIDDNDSLRVKGIVQYSQEENVWVVEFKYEDVIHF